MTEHQHPITPPEKIMVEWIEEYWDIVDKSMEVEDYLRTQTTRYRKIADAELEACLQWFSEFYCMETWMQKDLEKFRAGRRPKPPSLAEQALDALEQVDEWAVANMSQLAIHDDLVAGVETIRAALKRLQELESNG